MDKLKFVKYEEDMGSIQVEMYSDGSFIGVGAILPCNSDTVTYHIVKPSDKEYTIAWNSETMRKLIYSKPVSTESYTPNIRIPGITHLGQTETIQVNFGQNIMLIIAYKDGLIKTRLYKDCTLDTDYSDVSVNESSSYSYSLSIYGYNDYYWKYDNYSEVITINSYD